MAKSAISGQHPRFGTDNKQGGIGTHSQRQSGTGTNQSGTDTHY